MIPNHIKKEIENYILHLSHLITGVKWESINKFHVTIKFLGNIDEDLYKDISKELNDGILQLSSFETSVNGLSGFPNLMKAKVIVLKLENSEYFQSLYDLTENICFKNGIAKDKKKFTPHITIGRVKNNFKINKKIKAFKSNKFKIGELAIINSKISHMGSEYKNLNIFNL